DCTHGRFSTRAGRRPPSARLITRADKPNAPRTAIGGGTPANIATYLTVPETDPTPHPARRLRYCSLDVPPPPSMGHRRGAPPGPRRRQHPAVSFAPAGYRAGRGGPLGRGTAA